MYFADSWEFWFNLPTAFWSARDDARTALNGKYKVKYFVFENCSAIEVREHSVWQTPAKKDARFFWQKIIYRVSVKNQCFDQPVELLWETGSTLDILKRYGCLWVNLPHYFAKQTRDRKSWWGWLGCTSVDTLLEEKTLNSRQGTHPPLETSATSQIFKKSVRGISYEQCCREVRGHRAGGSKSAPYLTGSHKVRDSTKP